MDLSRKQGPEMRPFYTWRTRYGGWCLRALEDANHKLKRLLAELMPDVGILRVRRSKKASASQRRSAPGAATRNASERSDGEGVRARRALAGLQHPPWTTTRTGYCYEGDSLYHCGTASVVRWESMAFPVVRLHRRPSRKRMPFAHCVRRARKR
jgi:hypothetical protein